MWSVSERGLAFLSCSACCLTWLACAGEPPGGEAVFPGIHWEHRSPAELGLSARKLEALAQLAGGRGCVVRHGYIGFEWGDPSKSSDVASAFKPLLSTLLFMAVEDGKLHSVDDPVSNFEPRLKTLNQGKDGGITWRHLASQTSGYGLIEAPGQAYAYNDFALALYYDTLTLKVFGMEGTAVLKKRLAEPLEFEDPCIFDALGAGKRPGRLAVSVRDFARFGLLYLRQGRWKDKQLVRPGSIDQAIHSPLPPTTRVTSGREAEMLPHQRSVGGSRNITPIGPGFYSFNWWLNGTDKNGHRLFVEAPPDAYVASGHGGKRMLWILPDLDLIVVWNEALIEDHDASPGNPNTKCNQAAKLIRQSVEDANGHASAIPDKLVVLTFDDAVKSHRTFVAPLLKELGFGATFFVTHRWMDDRTNFMTWEDIAEIHQMGFEIGNHSWTHSDFSMPKNAARLAGELALVDRELDGTKPKVPRPVSFAYCGNTFGPEAVQRLAELGYKFARRGEQPEARYATLEIGSTYDPKRHHPLLIPTTGDAYPIWTLEHFKSVSARATNGQIVVLQFHGAPDVAHPWVHTPPERLREYLAYLKENGFRCIAMRDLEPYVDREHLPSDPMLTTRQPPRASERLALPAEMEATRRDLKFWLENMLVHHHYTWAEAARVCGWSVEETQKKAKELKISPGGTTKKLETNRIHILSYPGGREVRRGFLDGCIDFQRGTKASVFLPWSETDYVVVDLPEAIFSEKRLLYLAHTHIPTIWDEQNVIIENIDWTREPDGSLHHERVLSNHVAFGASLQSKAGAVEMELWLRNGSGQPLTGLRVQVCNLLKGAPEFNEQTTTNKIFRSPCAAVQSAGAGRWILTAWQRCGRAWGNGIVPCLHADPVLPDCAPGQTVRVRGRLWFYEGKDVELELQRAQSAFQ